MCACACTKWNTIQPKKTVKPFTDVRQKPAQRCKAIILPLKINKSKRIAAFVQNQQACYCKQLWCVFKTSNAYDKHVALCLNLKQEQNLAICGHVWTLRTVCSVKEVREKDKHCMISLSVKTGNTNQAQAHTGDCCLSEAERHSRGRELRGG